MTSVEQLKRLVSETRSVYDKAALEFLQALPTPENVAFIKSKLEAQATNCQYRLVELKLYGEASDKVEVPNLCARLDICFHDFHKTSFELDINKALEDIKKRTETYFPGSVVFVGLKELGVPWIEMRVLINLI